MGASHALAPLLWISDQILLIIQVHAFSKLRLHCVFLFTSPLSFLLPRPLSRIGPYHWLQCTFFFVCRCFEKLVLPFHFTMFTLLILRLVSSPHPAAAALGRRRHGGVGAARAPYAAALRRGTFRGARVRADVFAGARLERGGLGLDVVALGDVPLRGLLVEAARAVRALHERGVRRRGHRIWHGTARCDRLSYRPEQQKQQKTRRTAATTMSEATGTQNRFR